MQNLLKTFVYKLLKTTIISLCFVLLLVSSNRQAFATTGTNKQISFQGKVVNTNGTNVTSANYDFEFKLYTVATVGTAIWTETRITSNQVTVTDGVFQVNLGSVTALPGSVDFNTDNIYLGVNFNNNGEMTPRIQFTAVPQAFNALKVAGLTVTDTTGTLTIPNEKTISFADAFTTSGAFALTLTTTGITNVTLPTTGTLSTLAGVETLTNKTIGSTGLVFSGATTDISTVSNEDLGIVPGGTGKVGIGTTTPSQMLDILGSATASGNITMGGQLQLGRFAADPTQIGVGSMFYNTATNKFRCYQNAAWTDCIGTGGSGPWTDDIGFTYLTDTAEDLVLGASTVASAKFFIDVSAGTLYLGTNEVLSGGLTFYSSGAGETDPTITANAAGDLTLSAPSGKVVVGAGSGNIKFSLTGETDILLADKIITLTGAYSSTDFTFNRVFTGGAYGQDGKVFLITDTSGGAGTINPDMLVVNSALTSGTFTGNLLRLQVGGTDKFAVGSDGKLTISGATTDITTAATENLTLTAGTTGDVIVSGDADTNFQVSFSAAPTVDMTSITNSGFGTTTTGVDGLQIDFVTAAVTGAVTNAGIQLNVTSGATEASDTLYGINIGNLTGQTGTEYALVIGTGWDRGLSVSSASTFTAALTSEATATIGTGGNTFTFNPASGPVYAGTARPTKTITLSPEYASAALTADGSGTTNGSMTSDNTLNAGSIGWKNYYQWSSTQAALQDYTVTVKVTLPQDFDGWQTGSCPSSTCALEIAYQTGVAGTTNNTVSVLLNNAETTPATVICTIAAASSITWTSFGCTSTNLATSPAWNTAGSVAIIRIKLAANSTASALARTGDITLRYFSKF